MVRKIQFCGTGHNLSKDKLFLLKHRAANTLLLNWRSLSGTDRSSLCCVLASDLINCVSHPTLPPVPGGQDPASAQMGCDNTRLVICEADDPHSLKLRKLGSKQSKGYKRIFWINRRETTERALDDGACGHVGLYATHPKCLFLLHSTCVCMCRWVATSL